MAWWLLLLTSVILLFWVCLIDIISFLSGQSFSKLCYGAFYIYIYIYIYGEREREREREREPYTPNYEITIVHFVTVRLANMINPSLGQSFSKLCYIAFCILTDADMPGHKYLHMK